jgi:hypothetical protein
LDKDNKIDKNNLRSSFANNNAFVKIKNKNKKIKIKIKIK